MLKSIDVLIGLSVVMLVLSAVVTAMTQFLVHISQAKGRKLREGIADLLQQIAPQFERKAAEEIAETVLTHPLVRRSEGKLSDTIHRQELVKLILELSTASTGHKLSDESKKMLKDALAADGISNPEAILDNTRSLMLQLELMKPELSNAVRSDLALLQEANSRFLAKINGWFDQTIDRTTDRFTGHVRTLTFACAAIVVLLLQVDTVRLVNQLSVDQQLRKSLVEQAVKITNAPAPGENSKENPLSQLTQDLKNNQDQFSDLATLGLFHLPRTRKEWTSGLRQLNYAGVLISMVLLSLGAPFWYNALKTLLQFRSVVANKDDGQRKERQTITDNGTAQPAQPAAAAAAAGAGAGASALIGERGFLG